MSRTRHKGNGHDPRHVTETPDVSHIKNPDVTHEASDVSVSGVARFVVGLTILTIVVFLLMAGLFRFLNTQETEKEPEPGPMAMSPQERLPPPPRLQAAPGFEVKLQNGELVKLENKAPDAEYRVLRDQWKQRLDCSSDSSATSSGNAKAPGCISIEDAMEKLIQSGPPSRVKSISEGGPGWRAEDFGIDPPTAASSGRVSEGGKQ